MILPTASREKTGAPLVATPAMTRPARSGVRNTPSRLDADALQTAAETLPRAMEVKAIEDWTVEGRQHKNRMPRYSSGVMSGAISGTAITPQTGKRMKVAEKMLRCKRTCDITAQIASHDTRAP